MFNEIKDNEKMTIDLHKMSVVEAKCYLEKAVMAAPAHIKEITVIHGYHNGDALMNMVRKQFKCKRVLRKFVTMNKGETIFIMNPEEMKEKRTVKIPKEFLFMYL